MEPVKLLVLETTPWQHHLQTSIEISIDHALNRGPVEFWFFEGASTERNTTSRKILNALKKSHLLTTALDLRPEIAVLERFQREIVERDLPITFQRVTQDCWAKSGKRPHHRIRRVADFRYSGIVELATLEIDGLSAGGYILSSLVSECNDPLPDVAKRRRLIERSLAKFSDLADFVRKIFDASEPDEVLVFNGRFAEQGPLIGLAEEREIPVFFHERGGLAGNTFFHEAWRPHDLRKKGQQALEKWGNLSPTAKKRTRASVLSSLTAARDQGGLVRRSTSRPKAEEFVTGHITESVKVVFFTSTETEFTFGNFAPLSAFKSQYEAVTAVSRACKELGWDLKVRVHPNVSGTSQKERRRWNSNLKGDLATGTLITSSSKIDSYSLLDTADLVAVWHSTIGLEALHAGIPVLSLAETPYEHAGAAVSRALKDRDLRGIMRAAVSQNPNPETGVPYLDYLVTHGYDFKLTNSEEWQHGYSRKLLPKLLRQARQNLKLVWARFR